MSVSAFGVEHGDIEKAFGAGLASGVKRIGSTIGGGVSSVAKPVGQQAGKNIARARAKPQGVGGAFNRIAGASGVRAGQGLRRAGTAMANRPGLTGGTALGVGGVGAFGAGRSSNKNQRMAQYR